MAIFYVQLTSLTIILLGNFISGIAPFFFLKTFFRNDHDGCRRNRALAYLIYFGGGVFMSTCFLELQPRASEEYEKHYHTQCLNQRIQDGNVAENKSESKVHKDGFPIPELIILCGFFFVFAIEEFLQFISGGFRKKSKGIQRKIPFCSCAKRHTECSRTFKACHAVEQTLYGLEKELMESKREEDGPEYHVTNRSIDITLERKLLQSPILSQPVPNYGAVTNIAHLNATPPVPILANPIVFDEDGKVTVAKPPPNPNDYIPSTTYLLLAITLIIYNINQGVSLGHLRDFFTWSKLIQCVQQFLISFVAGSAISQISESSLPVMCYIGLLSIMCPLGISITMIFNNTLAEISHLAKSIISASLCGSLLYLTFFDFLRGSKLYNTPSLGKFSFFTMGFVVVTGLQYISVFT